MQANTYASLTTESPSRLKRFAHRRRFEIAMQLLHITPGDRVLDFGTGSGQLLYQIAERYPTNRWNLSLAGYEPSREMIQATTSDDVHIYHDLGAITDETFNKICCLEVLEHLTPHNQEATIHKLLEASEPDARIIVSVPIELGLASLGKNLVRLAAGQRHGGTTPTNILKSLFGFPINREQSEYISSHIGFYFTDIEKLFSKMNLRPLSRTFSPLGFGGPTINSQVFYVLQASKRHHQPAD